MQKIRMGIVGLGIMGRRYYTMLRALAGVEVTALCVRHLDTIDDLPGAKFADYRRLFASGQHDAVIIATPHYSHPQVAIEALHYGIHVLVDKPLAVHVADGRRMLAAHRDKALRFGVMFQERSRPLLWHHQSHDSGRCARRHPPCALDCHGLVPFSSVLSI